MRKMMVAAIAALSLSACAANGGISGIPAAPAPLEKTTVDEKALLFAAAGAELALTAVDQAVLLGKLPFGSPIALRAKGLIEDIQAALNAAAAARKALSTTEYLAAIAEGEKAMAELNSLLKGK